MAESVVYCNVMNLDEFNKIISYLLEVLNRVLTKLCLCILSLEFRYGTEPLGGAPEQWNYA